MLVAEVQATCRKFAQYTLGTNIFNGLLNVCLVVSMLIKQLYITL